MPTDRRNAVSAPKPPSFRPSADTSIGVSRFAVDLRVPLEELSAAVEIGDDLSIWRLYRRSMDPDLFLDWLGNLISNTTSVTKHPRDPRRNTELRHALFMVPVILASPWTRDTATPTEEVGIAQAMRSDLQAWWGAGTSVSLHSTLIPYRDLCRWSPSTAHRLLLALARQPAAQGKLPPLVALTPTEGLPDLVFVAGCAHRWLAFPELPAPRPQEDHWLRERIAGNVGFLAGTRLAAGAVGQPDYFCESVRDGAVAWLKTLVNELEVTGWQVSPESEDITQLLLHSTSGEHATLSVPVRLHQVGLHGLDLLVAQLSETAGKNAAPSAEVRH